LEEGRARQQLDVAQRVPSRRTPGPRLHGELATQREDAALVHAPKLGVERGRDARMIGRLEVVAACDGGLEIPTGPVEPPQRLEPAGTPPGRVVFPARPPRRRRLLERKSKPPNASHRLTPD